MKNFFILTVLLIVGIIKTYGQKGLDLPLLEDFENTENWLWKPWRNITRNVSLKNKIARHTGSFGLDCKDDFFKRIDVKIGLTGQAISWWVRFKTNTPAYCGFGINDNEIGYYLCVDLYTNKLYFSNSPNYTNPPLKFASQKYKLNMWYRAEVVFNSTTNVTANLYSFDGITMLNSINIEIPELTIGGVAFRGHGSIYVDDIRGGIRNLQMDIDTCFAPKLGTPLILKNIVFETSKSILLKESYSELNKLVAYLKRNPTYKINVIGHTDNIGNEENNLNLSKARAKAVADYLMEQGVNKAFIKYNGLGCSKPIASNDKEVGRKINRRVECTIDNK